MPSWEDVGVIGWPKSPDLKRLESRIWILLVQSSIFETNDLMFVCRASTRSWVARVVWLWICVISLACELHTCSILSRNLRCQALPFSPTSTPEVDANRLAHAIPAVAGCPRQGGTVTFVNAWLSFSNPITDWQDLDSCMVHSPQAKFFLFKWGIWWKGSHWQIHIFGRACGCASEET